MGKTTHKSRADLSSPESRARRIRYVRENLLNLSRTEMCKSSQMVEPSLKSWELALAGGLTEKGAKKLSLAFKKFGLYCSAPWLLHEIGYGPIRHSEHLNMNANEEQQIANELLEFRKQSNAIDTIIMDESMVPVFYPGTLVAGMVIKDLKNALGKECIVVTQNDERLVRRLEKGRNKNVFNLIALNPDYGTANPEIKNLKIKSAAPILWIRKRTQSLTALNKK